MSRQANIVFIYENILVVRSQNFGIMKIPTIFLLLLGPASVFSASGMLCENNFVPLASCFPCVLTTFWMFTIKYPNWLGDHFPHIRVGQSLSTFCDLTSWLHFEFSCQLARSAHPIKIATAAATTAAPRFVHRVNFGLSSRGFVRVIPVPWHSPYMELFGTKKNLALSSTKTFVFQIFTPTCKTENLRQVSQWGTRNLLSLRRKQEQCFSLSLLSLLH